MKRFLTENIWWKVLSVLLAFLLWIAVAREPELATSVSVPILFRDLPTDMVIASDIPDRVHLEIRGPASHLTPQQLAQSAVVLDLKSLLAGQQTFTILPRDIQKLPSGVQFLRASPSQITLRFERDISKEVPVEPVYSSEAPDGYTVTEYTFSPPSVRVRGPESHVRNIDHVNTDPIDLSGIVSQTMKQVKLSIGDPQVRLESNSTVKLYITLQKIQN